MREGGRGGKGPSPILLTLTPANCQGPSGPQPYTGTQDGGLLVTEETFKNRGRRRRRWRCNDVTNELLVTMETILWRGRFPVFC